MEELLQNLNQATNPDPNVQSTLAEYINFQIQNIEFGHLLFAILEGIQPDIPANILSLCCNLLKSWAKIQWPLFEFDKKCIFFQRLKNLLMKDHPVINDLSIVFIDVASSSHSIHSDVENSRCYESHIFDFFNRIAANPPIGQLHALTNIIYFISRNYKQTFLLNKCSEPTLLFTRVCNVFIPLFQNDVLLQIPEGCEILILSLSIFKTLFFHIFIQKVTQALHSDSFGPNISAISAELSISPSTAIAKIMMEKAVIPIAFAQNILIAFSQKNIVDLRLVSNCCRFLNSFYRMTIFNERISIVSIESNKFMEFFTSIENIIKLYFNVLNYALEVANSDTFLIPSILKVFETFRKFLPPQIELLNIFLNAARLTQVDKEEFFNSPNIFYLNVYANYKDSDLHATPQISKSIIYSMVKKNYQLLMDMISSMQIEEHVIRCISYCLPLIKKLRNEDFDLFINFLNQYYVNLIQFTCHDLTYEAARIYFLYHFVQYLSNDQKVSLMNEVVSHYFILFLNQANEGNDLNGLVIVMLNSCKLLIRLLKNKIQPFSFEGALQSLVAFHSFYFTPIVIDAIKMMVENEKEKIIPFAEAILEKAFISLNVTFPQYLEAGCDPSQLESSTKSISSNLDLCSLLIESTTVKNEKESFSFLIKPEFIDIIQTIFSNNITDCYEELIRLLSSIFATCSDLIPQLCQLWFNFALSPSWIGFICQLVDPFFCIISHSPHLFLELHISENIEELCLSNLIDQKNFESTSKFASLLSWICLIDPSFDAEPEFQCVQLICGGFCATVSSSLKDPNFNPYAEINIVPYASLFELAASLTISRKILPPEQILLTMVKVAVKHNWPLRIDQKRLYSIFLLTVIILLKNGNCQYDQDFFNSLLTDAFYMLNKEIIQREMGFNTYFANFKGSFPDDLAFLTEEEFPFQSPQEQINISALILNAFQAFNNEFLQSLNAQFPDVFRKILNPQ